MARAGAAAAVFVGIVGLWLLSVDARSLSTRPWIGGSKDGSALRLVFGYNFSGFGGQGGLPPGLGRGGGPGPFAGLFMAFGGDRGVGRMFNAGMGDQVMWWFPIAVFGLVASLVGRERWRQRDPLVGAAAMWGLWTLVAMTVFSYTKGVLHPYYVVELAPPIAALAAIGAVRAWQTPDNRWRTAGGAAIVATAGLQLVLLRRNPSYGWMRPTVIVVAASAAIAVLIGRSVSGVRSTPLWRSSIAAICVALLVAPLLWSLTAVRHTVGGLFPAARPGDSFSFGPPTNGLPYGASDFTDATLRWLNEQRTTERWTVAMASARVAEDAIIAGHRVLGIGGFNGSDRAANPARVADAVAAGRLRFFLAGGGIVDGSQEPEVFAAVRSVCAQVPSSAWGGRGVSGVYDCRGRAGELRDTIEPVRDADLTP